jgi:hypothetical protein
MAATFTRREVNLALLSVAIGLARSEATPPPETVTLFDFAIAGGHHHALRTLYPDLVPGTRLPPAPEPLNPHDVNAVAVLTADGVRLGYVPRGANAPVARLIARGARLDCVVVGRIGTHPVHGVPKDLVYTACASGDPILRLTSTT